MIRRSSIGTVPFVTMVDAIPQGRSIECRQRGPLASCGYPGAVPARRFGLIASDLCGTRENAVSFEISMSRECVPCDCDILDILG